MAKAAVSEIDIQATFRKRLYYAAPEVKVVAIPNAGRRTMWEAGRLKREGIAKGFPDCLCLWPGGGVAMIEFKTDKGRVSDDQGEWIARLDEYGFPVRVCRSADEAVDFLRSCGAPIRERAA